MKIAVATENDYYWELARDYLENISTDLSSLSAADFDSGRVYKLNPDAIIFDMNSGKLGESDTVLDFIEEGLVPCIIVENDLRQKSNLKIAGHFRKLSEEIAETAGDENIQLLKVAGEKQHTPIWVLCSSSGGPSTLNELLSQIEDPLNCCIVVVQHISPEGLKMLTSTLRSHINGWEIVLSTSSPRIAPGKVIVCDPSSELTVSEGGRCVPKNHSREQKFYPCIDQTIQNLVDGYGVSNLSVAILTGMGSDGAIATAKHGANFSSVVAQTAESSAVKSMPEAAAKAFPETLRKNPREIGVLINQLHKSKAMESA